MPNQKHFTQDDRGLIHEGLDQRRSFRQMAIFLDKDPTSISKEVRKHRVLSDTGTPGRIANRCIHKTSCVIQYLCASKRCNRSYCRSCKKCNELCTSFQEEQCLTLSHPPYVCNGCEQKSRCVLKKYFYRALPAQKNYLKVLSVSREGVCFTEDEVKYIDSVITPLVKKKQSIYHICVTQADKLCCAERTIYNLIDRGLLSCRNIDLPRKVRYRARRKPKEFKVDKMCRIGRTYEDFKDYMKEHPDTPVVEIDSVEGAKGGKVLLTIFFNQSDLLLMFLRDHNTSASVIDVFNHLDGLLGRDDFSRLLHVVIGDNGSEFSNPTAIEFDAQGTRRTTLFYCDPSSPHQKPHIERAHEYIRMIIPKGRSFDNLTQSDVNLMACHINSQFRKKLNEKSPITAFSFFHGEDTLHKLGIVAVPPEEVTLSEELLCKRKEANSHVENI